MAQSVNRLSAAHVKNAKPGMHLDGANNGYRYLRIVGSVGVKFGEIKSAAGSAIQHDDAQPCTPCHSTSQNGFQPPSGVTQGPTKPAAPKGIFAIS